MQILQIFLRTVDESWLYHNNNKKHECAYPVGRISIYLIVVSLFFLQKETL